MTHRGKEVVSADSGLGTAGAGHLILRQKLTVFTWMLGSTVVFPVTGPSAEDSDSEACLGPHVYPMHRKEGWTY